MVPYGPTKYRQDRIDEYSITNPMRYAWVFKLYIHFCTLEVTRPAEYLGMIATILENIKTRENPNSASFHIFKRTTEFLEKLLAVKPLKADQVIEDTEYDNFLTQLKEEPIPKLMVCDEPLRQVTIVPDGFDKNMKYAVAAVLEGCIFATCKIEIFCNLQKSVCKKVFPRSGRQRICKFKGIEMVYEILDRSYLK